MEIRYGRKRSGIARELNQKIEEWIATIDDEDLRSLVRKNTIVTGGSIASMLLGEEVNDYDVYFRDKATALAVAEYYVNKWNETHKEDVSDRCSVKTGVPAVRIEELPNVKGEIEERVTIYIKSSGVVAEAASQYDYFEMRSEDAVSEYVDSLAIVDDIDDGKGKYRPVFMSQNAITLSNKLQIIIRFYGEPTKIHDNYDFVHTMCYWDHGTADLVLLAEALEALLSRTLVYRGSLYPIASIFRTKKFIDRGWRISAGQLLKIMWQISEIDLKDAIILREQLTGVDIAYMSQLITALRDVEKDKINSTYVACIIDKIFN